MTASCPGARPSTSMPKICWVRGFSLIWNRGSSSGSWRASPAAGRRAACRSARDQADRDPRGRDGRRAESTPTSRSPGSAIATAGNVDSCSWSGHPRGWLPPIGSVRPLGRSRGPAIQPQLRGRRACRAPSRSIGLFCPHRWPVARGRSRRRAPDRDGRRNGPDRDLRGPPRAAQSRSHGGARVGGAAYRFIDTISRPPDPGASSTRNVGPAMATVRPSVATRSQRCSP